MDAAVDIVGHLCEEFAFGAGGIQRVEEVVQVTRHLEVDTSLVAEDARLHVDQVILRCFLVFRVIAFDLEFLCFQEVAGVIFIGDGGRDDVQLFQPVDEAAFTSHRQHLQYAVLGAVVGVLGSAFPLGNPYIFMFFRDGIVDVA